MPNWSEENFHIKSRIPKRKPVFKLAEDLGDNKIRHFYEEEQQPIEENRYLIERINRERKTHHGNQEFLFKWKGWQTKFNSWVKKEDCEYIQKSKDDESD